MYGYPCDTDALPMPVSRANTSKKIKPLPYTRFPQIEKQLLQWFNSVRIRGIPGSKFSLLFEAHKIAHELNLISFKASYSWLSDFKKRNNISYRKINDFQIKTFRISSTMQRLHSPFRKSLDRFCI